jgi:hypothetical protein
MRYNLRGVLMQLTETRLIEGYSGQLVRTPSKNPSF